MAVIKKDGNFMGLPMNIQRGNPIPLDNSEIYYSLSDAQEYAQNGATAYVGQIIVVVNESEGTATPYVIANTAGALSELGAGTSSAMIFVDTIAALKILGTPPTGVPDNLEVGQQAFVSEDNKIHFLTSVGDSAPTSYIWNVQASDAPVWNDTSVLVTFYTTTAAGYAGIQSKDENTIYFITDEGKIYKGSTDVTSMTKVVDSFGEATSVQPGKLYIGPAPSGDTSGCELRVVNNGSWVTISPGYYTDGANWASADSNKLATIGLIKKALQEVVGVVQDGAVGDVVIVGEDNKITDSGYKLGGAVISENPDAKTLATEKAVIDVMSWKPLPTKVSSPDDFMSALSNPQVPAIEISQDMTVPVEIEVPEGREVTLNLNNHTVSSSGSTRAATKGRVLTNKGTLTITGDGVISSASLGVNGTGAINNDGTLIIEGGTFQGGQGANGAVVNNRAGGVMIVNGGTFEGCPRGIQNLGTLTINDGTFTGTDSYTGSKEGNAIISATGAQTTINGGTFTGNLNAVSNMDNSGAVLKITGGTFKSDGSDKSGAIYNGLGSTLVIDDCVAITEGESDCCIVNKGTATINKATIIGDNCVGKVYALDSGQGASSNATLEVGKDVNVTGTFGALRVVSGTATIKGGTYKVVDCENHEATPYYALYVSSSSGTCTVNVEDGVFESPNNAVRCGESMYSQACNMNISGGTFISTGDKAAVAQESPGVVSITGGTYSSNVQDYVAEGHQVIESEGKFIVNAVNA